MGAYGGQGLRVVNVNVPTVSPPAGVSQDFPPVHAPFTLFGGGAKDFLQTRNTSPPP